MWNSSAWLLSCLRYNPPPTHTLLPLSSPVLFIKYILFLLPAGSLIPHFYLDTVCVWWDWWKYQETWDDGACRLDRDCKAVVGAHIPECWWCPQMLKFPLPECWTALKQKEHFHCIRKGYWFVLKIVCCSLPQLLLFKWFHAFFSLNKPLVTFCKCFLFPHTRLDNFPSISFQGQSWKAANFICVLWKATESKCKEYS